MQYTKSRKMLLLMCIHRSSLVEHVDAMICIPQAVKPTTVLDFCFQKFKFYFYNRQLLQMEIQS